MCIYIPVIIIIYIHIYFYIIYIWQHIAKVIQRTQSGLETRQLGVLI